MTSTFRCDDKETLVAYLYDEIDAEARRQVALHLRTCAACTSELAALQSVRQDLAAWQPPEAQLDFAIVQKPATVLRPSRWFAPSVPVWAQAAAAVLVLAAGLAIANVQVRYGSDGVTVSTGWMTRQVPAAMVEPGPSRVETTALQPRPATDDWRPAFAALESELRRELQRIRTSATPVRARAEAPQAADADALLRRVQALVTASEQRQRQELALRMTQFSRDVQMQRQGDLVRISQDLGNLRGRTGAVEGNMVNLIRRVSTTQVP